MYARPFRAWLLWCIRHDLTPPGVRPSLLRLAGHTVPNSSVVFAGLRFSGPGRLVVGANSFISDDCLIDCSADVTIGDRVDLAAGVRLITAGHDYTDARRRAGARRDAAIHIDDGAWLGAGAMVLGGVRVGADVVVAAGAVVTCDCLPHGLYAGVPARRIKELPTYSQHRRPAGRGDRESA